MPSFNPAAVRAITFDLYGTLLDLEATFAPAFDGFLRERGVDADAAEFVRTWEWAYLHEGMVDTFIGGPRTPFERLRRTTLSQVLARMGIEHSRDDIEDLLAVRAMPTLFPDVVESLNAMRGRYTLSVLSNGDLSVLERIVSTRTYPSIGRSRWSRQAATSPTCGCTVAPPNCWKWRPAASCMWRPTPGTYAPPKPPG